MPNKPVSKTMARLNEDIKRGLVEIVSELKDPRMKNGLVTITRVETDSDLQNCKVFVSVIGDAKKDNRDEAKAVVEALKSAKGHVRSEVASRMHLRRAPEFHFVLDDNAAYAAHINELLDKL